MTASFQAVMYGPLHYRPIDMDKTSGLQHFSLAEIKWWRVHSAYNVVQHGQPKFSLFAYVSSYGWGVLLDSTTSRGAWSSSEALCHINYLEMLAVHFAVKTFRVHLEAKHATVMIEKKKLLNT